MIPSRLSLERHYLKSRGGNGKAFTFFMFLIHWWVTSSRGEGKIMELIMRRKIEAKTFVIKNRNP